MNTAVNAPLSNPLNLNVVHEAEAQRQHARVKLPGKIRFIGSNREVIEQRLYDISAGGFSFDRDRLSLQVGNFYKGKLLFQLDSLTLSLEIEFQVKSLSGENGRVGCEFHSLKPRDISTLRHLISAHLSGELISVGDLLSTLQRDNFGKARKQNGDGNGMGFFSRMRAASASAAVFVLGLLAFSYILNQIYSHYFVTHAESGQIAVPNMEVTMPREGTVTSLVPLNGLVKKGAPIGTFSATMLEMLKGSLTEEQLTADNVEAFFGRQLQGTLTSPCDCRVVEQLVADGQFASKGTAVFRLAPQDSVATVEARFRYRHFDSVQPGSEVSMRIAGEATPVPGKIVKAVLQDGGLSSDIRVNIQPDHPLSTELAGRPVEVVVHSGPTFDWVVDKAAAVGL
jgi:alginate biosynthesis protein Alg44